MAYRHTPDDGHEHVFLARPGRWGLSDTARCKLCGVQINDGYLLDFGEWAPEGETDGRPAQGTDPDR